MIVSKGIQIHIASVAAVVVADLIVTIVSNVTHNTVEVGCIVEVPFAGVSVFVVDVDFCKLMQSHQLWRILHALREQMMGMPVLVDWE